MSTTFFQVLSDDPQLEKQIGCMTGLLQIFDRQQALRGKRFPGRTTRRISSGASKAPPTKVSPNNATATSLNHSPGRGMKKTGDNTSAAAWNESSGDMLVLELGHRESCGALSQGEFKEAADPKRRGSVDLKESLRLLAKLKEAPWNYNVDFTNRQDAPRLSYDGVRSCFEFKDALRASQRVRDAPRLSLDGRGNVAAASTQIRMRPTSNVVARLMGLEELPDPCHTPRSTSKREDVAAVGRKVKPLHMSSSPSLRYVMSESVPRPPPIQDSSSSTQHSKALTKSGFSQDMEKQLMYLRLEESVEQRNILKDIVEVMHFKGLLHWHGAAKVNSRKQTNNRVECQANPRPARDISHQNVRGLNTSDGVTKVQSSRAAVKQVKAARQKNATSTRKEINKPNLTRRASEATQVELHLRKHALAKSTSQRDERECISEVMQECRASMVAHDQQHSPASVLELFDDCHPRTDQVEAYVKQILDAAGWLHGGHPLPCLNSTLFLALEKGSASTKVAVMHRRLIFDCVNHILARQMQQPCCFTNSCRHPGDGQALLQQVVEELQCVRFEDVGEMLQDIVDKDVAAMSDWSSGELALHVERLLFKQLVDETIQDMTKLSSRNVSRQLFL